MISILLLQGCSDRQERMPISDRELLNYFIVELNKLGVAYDDKDDGAVYVSKTDHEIAKDAALIIYNKYFSPDRSASYSRFMNTTIQSYLKERNIPYKEVCFLYSSYIMWSEEHQQEITAAEKYASEKLHEIWDTTPQSEWNKIIDDSVVICS